MRDRFPGYTEAELRDELEEMRQATRQAEYETAKADRRIAALHAQLAEKEAQLVAAERERDLAIAHDRQPYPTADAYERVCAALQRKEAQLAETRAALVRYGDHEGDCNNAGRVADFEPQNCSCGLAGAAGLDRLRAAREGS